MCKRIKLNKKIKIFTKKLIFTALTTQSPVILSKTFLSDLSVSIYLESSLEYKLKIGKFKKKYLS